MCPSITDGDPLVSAGHVDAVSIDDVRRRVVRASPLIDRALAQAVLRTPAGFRAPQRVPRSAIGLVLAREAR